MNSQSSDKPKPLTATPEQMLKKLRSFCNKFFYNRDHMPKPERLKRFYEYLSPRIGNFCDVLNTDFLNREASLIYLESPCYVFGDLHGNVLDVFQYEERIWKKDIEKKKKSGEKLTKYVFLGDFVDRGKYSVEVVLYLFALKLLKPEQFILVRGNHEIRSTNSIYTLPDECNEKFGRVQGQLIYEKLNDCFSRLPLAVVIDHSVFCCHGGVPRHMPNLEDIRLVEKPLIEPPTNSIAHELMWNDPIESMTTFNRRTASRIKLRRTMFVANKMRRTGYYYSHFAVNKFLRKNRLHHIIRAHECEHKGYKFCANGRVITIFSSSHYDGDRNTTACVEVTATTLRIIILKDPKRDGIYY